MQDFSTYNDYRDNDRNRFLQPDGSEDCHEAYYDLDFVSDENDVFFSALLEMFVVPSKQRKSGVGKALFEKLESELPPSVKYLSLISADLGSGNTFEFWKARGFVPAFDYDSAPQGERDEMKMIMVKDVNGTPNPAPLPIQMYEDEPLFVTPETFPESTANYFRSVKRRP